MSEYQYYEFAAIDKPLTAAQMAELRARSSRATITPGSFINHYQWGNLKGDPADWMRRYFDAHVYVANWCSCWLYLKLPKDVFDAQALRAYATQDAFTFEQAPQHWILQWALNESEDYDRFGSEDGSGWMARLMPLRDELLRGDLRALYIGWLAAVGIGEIVDEAQEPPPPPGLSRLSAAQQSLAEFLDIDVDLLASAGAAESNESTVDASDDAAQDAWLAQLPDTERVAALKLLLQGHGQQAERQVKTAFMSWQRSRRPAAEPAGERRTVAQLRHGAEIAATARQQREAAKRAKATAERKAKRDTYLRAVAANAERHWRDADASAQRGGASGYDAAMRTLVELAEASVLCDTRAQFEQAMAAFMARHGTRTALLRRVVEAGLWKKEK